MALTSSTLKTLIKSEIETAFGDAGTLPNLTADQAHDKFCEALAKAVAGWISANGSGVVDGIATGGPGPYTADLNASDDL